MDYIGIDYGTKIIGLSWGNDDLGIAVPLEAIKNFHTEGAAFQMLEQRLKEYACYAFVLGLPLHMDGKEGKRVVEVKNFSHQLQLKFNKPIFFQDERLSTQTAFELLAPRLRSLKRAKKQKQSGILDSQSAAVILQDFLNNKKHLLP